MAKSRFSAVGSLFPDSLLGKGTVRATQEPLPENRKIVVITMDAVNAGAVFCHLADDESFFCFARCAKSLYVFL